MPFVSFPCFSSYWQIKCAQSAHEWGVCVWGRGGGGEGMAVAEYVLEGYVVIRDTQVPAANAAVAQPCAGA